VAVGDTPAGVGSGLQKPDNSAGLLIVISASASAPALQSLEEQSLQVLFDAVYTDLSGWLNGIRNMEISQPSFHDQRKGTRVCSPLIGSSEKDCYW